MRPEIGQVFTSSKVFSQADLDKFAVLSGDDNPIHVDPDFAAGSRFGSTVAHGMLLYGVICGSINEKFPGSVQLDQRMIFMAPTYTREEVAIRCEVVEVLPKTRQFTLAVLMTSMGGEVVCDGETTLIWSVS